MPRRTFVNDQALAALLTKNEFVVTHAELKEIGLPASTIMTRILPGGPWQRILPGVVLARTGKPTRRERRLAAVKCSGPQSQLTGMSALAEYGVQAARMGEQEQMVNPHGCHRGSHDFVQIERTHRLSEAVLVRRLPCVPLARAVVDAARRSDDLDRIRAIVAEVVQKGRCTPDELLAEVRASARQRTALTWAALREILVGIRSVAEAKIRQVMRSRGLPEPEWNVSVFTPDGQFLATPDGYYADVAVALEVDSIEYHLSPKDYKRSQRRYRTLAAHGVMFLTISPGDALRDPDKFVDEVLAVLRQAALRRCPELVVKRPAAA